MVAGGLGLEPRFTAPKAAVLPLDDPPNKKQITACAACVRSIR